MKITKMNLKAACLEVLFHIKIFCIDPSLVSPTLRQRGQFAQLLFLQHAATQPVHSSRLQQKLWQLGRLAGPGLAHQDHGLVSLDELQKLLPAE